MVSLEKVRVHPGVSYKDFGLLCRLAGEQGLSVTRYVERVLVDHCRRNRVPVEALHDAEE